MVHFGQYGMDPLDTKYAQVYKPIYEQDKAVGHAVRATYMYTAMATWQVRIMMKNYIRPASVYGTILSTRECI